MHSGRCSPSRTHRLVRVGRFKQTSGTGDLDGSDIWNAQRNTACGAQDGLVDRLTALSRLSAGIVFKPELVFVDDARLLGRRRVRCGCYLWRRRWSRRGTLQTRGTRAWGSGHHGLQGRFIHVVGPRDTIGFKHQIVAVQRTEFVKFMRWNGRHVPTVVGWDLGVEGRCPIKCPSIARPEPAWLGGIEPPWSPSKGPRSR